MADPNVYQGPGGGGTNHFLVNAAALAADNTGATDAGPKLTSLLALTGPISGQTLQLPKGAYKIQSPIAVASNESLRGCADAAVNSTIAYVDGFTDCLFASNEGRVLQTTLSATVVEGASVCQVASVAGFTPGATYFVITRLDTGFSYLCTGVGVIGSTDITAAGLYGGGGSLNGKTLTLNVNGAGATTLNLNGATNAASLANLLAAIKVQWPALSIVEQGPAPTGNGINLVLAAQSLVIGGGSANANLGIVGGLNALQTDIPIPAAMQSGDEVNILSTRTHDVEFDFQNATLSGTGGRTTWFAAPWDTVVKNVKVQSSWAVFGLDYDIGLRRARFENCTVTYVANGPFSIGPFAIGFEGGQDGEILKCDVVGGGVHTATATQTFSAGLQVVGVAHKITSSTARGCYVGLSMQPNGLTDFLVARNCQTLGGNFDGNVYGVYVAGNSFQNTYNGTVAAYNQQYGIFVSTGNGFTPVAGTTNGASQNTFNGCVSKYNGSSGFQNGDGFFGPCDGNTYTGCVASNNGGVSGASGDGFVAANLTTNTGWAGCKSQDNTGDGYAVVAGSAGTTGVGCTSENNGGFGFNVGADSTFVGLKTLNDAAGGVNITGTANVEIVGGEIEATFDGVEEGVQMGSSGKCHVSGIVIKYAGSGTKLAIVQSAGTLYIDNIRMTGGGFGIDLTGGTLFIGPGCDFDSASLAPFTTSGGTAYMTQTGGVAAIPGTSTPVALTFAQHYNTSIELAAGATGDTTVSTYAFPGLTFVARNLSVHNLTLKTSTAATVVVAAGRSQLVQVTAHGDMVACTAAL